MLTTIHPQGNLRYIDNMIMKIIWYNLYVYIYRYAHICEHYNSKKNKSKTKNNNNNTKHEQNKQGYITIKSAATARATRTARPSTTPTATTTTTTTTTHLNWLVGAEVHTKATRPTERDVDTYNVKNEALNGRANDIIFWGCSLQVSWNKVTDRLKHA